MDIWACGCLLFQMVVGTPPFATHDDLEAGTVYEKIVRFFHRLDHVEYDFPPADVIELSDGVRALIRKVA